MPNVVACYKWVLDEADVRVMPDLSVDVSRAKMKISDYDLNAIQAASDLANQLQGQAIGLSYGDDRAKKSVKEALSRGLDEVVWVNDSAVSATDSFATSQVLEAVIRSLDEVAVVVCADGSSDQFARQTAPRLAALLDWPIVTSVSAVSVEGDKLVAQRQTEGGVEEVVVTLPAVIAVLPEVNEPPIPTLRQIMQAGKKPSRELPIAEVAFDGEPKVSVAEERGYAMDRKNIMIDPTADGWVAELLDSLRKEGVL